MQTPSLEARWRYDFLSQGLHWLMVPLLIAIFVVAQIMDALPDGPRAFWWYQLHKSLGMTLWVLALIRLLWALVRPRLAAAPGARWVVFAARWTHRALYLLLIVQPMIGIAHSWLSDFPLRFFGLIRLPTLLAADEALAEIFEEIHGFVGKTLMILVIFHVAAALWHGLWRRDGVFSRMVPYNRAP